MTSRHTINLTAVSYARYSSEHQDESSIIAQLDAIKKYAKQKRINVIKEYIDRAKSATTDDRPEFLQMIKDLKTGRISVNFVLVHKIDRFARNRYDAAFYRREIQKTGAKYIAVDQPLDVEARPEDIILESVLEGLAEYYSRNLAREVMKGMQVNAQNAKYNGGWVLFGYKIVDGCYEINESEALAVQKIFDLATQGRSYRAICDEVKSYRTRRGKPFSSTTIHEMLKNPKYAGIYVFNQAPRRIEGKRNWRRKKDKEEMVIIPGGVPAIIDEDTFWRVQKMLEKRQSGPREKSKGMLYILTGKLFCGDCGNVMTGCSQRRSKEGKQYFYYVCSNKQKNGKKANCTNDRWKKSEIEKAVIDEIKIVLKNTDALTDYIYDLYLEQEKKKKSNGDIIKEEIQELTGKIHRLLDLVESGAGDLSSASERISYYTSRKKELEYDLTQVSVPLYTKKHFKEYISYVVDNLEMSDTYQLKKILDTYIEKIILYPDKRVEIKLRFDISDRISCAYNAGVGGATFFYTHSFYLGGN